VTTERRFDGSAVQPLSGSSSSTVLQLNRSTVIRFLQLNRSPVQPLNRYPVPPIQPFSNSTAQPLSGSSSSTVQPFSGKPSWLVQFQSGAAVRWASRGSPVLWLLVSGKASPLSDPEEESWESGASGALGTGYRLSLCRVAGIVSLMRPTTSQWRRWKNFYLIWQSAHLKPAASVWSG